MRGKVCFTFDRGGLSGITPAYAGKRLPDTERGRPTRDHPRLCGEKHGQKQKYRQTKGSPPPMRGKDAFYGTAIENLGITPAYAGKSRSVRRSGILTQDHPRLCGEKRQLCGAYSAEKGSPPPMRGKAIFRRTDYNYGRITPAYAGKRFSIR